jgi:hypothetical protein
MHVRGVQPDEKRLAGPILALDEIRRGSDELVVASFHTLAVEWAGVFDPLLANAAPTRFVGRVVFLGCPGMDDTARAEGLVEVRKILLRGIVGLLRILFGVEMVEVPEEFIEAMIRRQHMVQVTEVVLAELPGGIALIFEERRNGHAFVRHAYRRGGNPDLGQAGAIHTLPRDEGRSARRAGLLAVGIGEQHAFLGDAIDVRRAIAHQPMCVATQIRLADVIAPDHQNIGLVDGHPCALG